ncbi:MAG: thioredoxin family protein [Phycisphaerae bacterium]
MGFASVLLPLAVCGCETPGFTDITSEQVFYSQIRRTDRPVLMYFYKPGCPTCVALEPGLMQLARDYGGHVAFDKFLFIYPWFEINSLNVAHDFNVLLVPTVILFVDGRERYRWFSDYYMPDYTSVLDQVLAERAQRNAQKALAGKNPATRPAS